MIEQRVTVVLEGGPSHPEARLSPEAAVQALRDLEGSRDVTMMLAPDGIDERLMVAVDGSRAFLGVERPDGLFQFASGQHDQQHETIPFTIGGQAADIEGRYLLDLPTAAIVVAEWLDGGESSTQGAWERQ